MCVKVKVEINMQCDVRILVQAVLCARMIAVVKYEHVGENGHGVPPVGVYID